MLTTFSVIFANGLQLSQHIIISVIKKLQKYLCRNLRNFESQFHIYSTFEGYGFRITRNCYC